MTRGAAWAAAWLAVAALSACRPASRTSETRERAYRANNRGVALLEQLKYPEAAAAFRDALTVDGSLTQARVNLSLALLYAQDLDGARREAEAADQRLPSSPQSAYILGLIARAESRTDAARGYFDRVRQLNPRDVGTAVNVAQIALEERRYDDAIRVLRPIVADEPSHVTASYVLGLALTRSGQVDEGQQFLSRAQALRQTGYAVAFGTGYLEQGRYAEALGSTGAEADLVDAATSNARFTPGALVASIGEPRTPASPLGRRFTASDLTETGVRDLAAGLGGGLTVLDADGDGDLDLVTVSASRQQWLRNDGSAWVDATPGSGLDVVPPGSVAIGVVAADYDNDGRVDLFVMRLGASSLYHNEGNGRFLDVSRAAGLPAFPFLPGAAAWVDVDHDGDVDLVIAGLADIEATRRAVASASALFPGEFVAAPVQLLRNNRNGTFTDVTRDARLEGRGHAVAIVPMDFDNRRDIDLLIVNRDGPPVLFANQRDGTFRDVSAAVGLDAVAASGDGISAVTAGDFNNDDWPDVFIARETGGLFAMSDGRGRFAVVPAPTGTAGASGAQLVDYDSDGLLDLILWLPGGPHVLRNQGIRAATTGEEVVGWGDVTSDAIAGPPPAGAAQLASPRTVAVADVNRDGRSDIVSVGGGSSWVWQNSGDTRRTSLRIDLHGQVSNRLGVGAKVQVRAGSLSARLDLSAATPAVAPADLVFGLGARSGADVARVLWTSGILQAEVPSGDAATLTSPFTINELDRKPSSCPFLFTWNGERFEFVTDFLGGGEMGDWVAPGVFNHPDPVEYVRIRGEQLRPRDGHLDVRVTNELEETLFLDRVQLLSVAHPRDVNVYPNEGMTDPPKPFTLHVVRDAHVPSRVTDEHGHDVTERVARLDRQYPDDFTLERIRGYARPHALTFDLGPGAATSVVLLTGWTDYAFSSDNVAATQAALSSDPPELAVRTPAGQWRTLNIAVGIPVGRPQTIPLNLSGLLHPGEHELRLTTSMRIYWDQIQVGTTVPRAGLEPLTLDPQAATLVARGFSAEVRPDGKNPPGYDYARVTKESPWKTMSGAFTREGDVLPLVHQSDDQFVIAKPGDEVALTFSAEGLKELPEGWTRTFLLRGDGFSKEMDINSASPHTVQPLPFHGMTRYPYPVTERYPDAPDQRHYQETYNTRQVMKPMPPLLGSR